MAIDFHAFAEELCKLGERSHMADFMAGVDPTGTKTFHYGMEDARAGRSSGVRRTVGTVGGLVGGATIVPSVVSSIIEGIKGGRSGGVRGAAVGAAKGTYKPFLEIVRAARGTRTLGKLTSGKAISQSEVANLKELAKRGDPALAPLVEAEALYAVANRPEGKKVLERARKFLGDRTMDVSSAIALSAALAGASANLQYRKGSEVGRELRGNT